MDRESLVEDEISRKCENRKDTKIPTTPGINVYSAAVIVSEIDDISRFGSKEKFAAYAGMVPRQQRTHHQALPLHALRFMHVPAAHSVIKYSQKLKKKYLNIVKRLGKNRAIVAIARLLIEIMYAMLPRGWGFRRRDRIAH